MQQCATASPKQQVNIKSSKATKLRAQSFIPSVPQRIQVPIPKGQLRQERLVLAMHAFSSFPSGLWLAQSGSAHKTSLKMLGDFPKTTNKWLSLMTREL